MRSIILTTIVFSSLIINQPQTIKEAGGDTQIPIESPKTTQVQQKAIKQYIPTEQEKEQIQSLIKAKSAKYGIDPIIPIAIIESESNYNPKAKGDTNYVCKRTGQIAPSHGLAQINECWHPEITLEQAHDIEFSVEFLVKKLSQGSCKEWMTCPLSTVVQ